MALIMLGAAWAQSYRFPSSDAHHGYFYPTAYRDNGGVDWNCGDITYSGHGGSDFGGGSWHGMDAGRDIVAAASGTVVDAHDGEYDRCSTGDCAGGGGYGNYVKITHADGRSTIYGHLKQWSVAVSAGQAVSCGQHLGQMGSSGYSTGPHVHFEVREASNYSSDPFDGPCSEPPSYWVDQGAYAGLPAPICEDVSPCAVVDRLRCGATITSANNASGATSSHAAYGGCVEYTYSGPEIAYEFATELDEQVTLGLSGLGADLDLMLLSSEACDGTGCLGSSSNPNADAESLTFQAAAGVRYVLVVDGWEGATSAFSLSAACAGGWPGEGDPGGDTAVDTAPPDDSGDTAPGGDTSPGGDTAPADEGPPGAAVERATFAGCGCASPPGPGPGPGTGPVSDPRAWLAGLLLLLRRRNPS